MKRVITYGTFDLFHIGHLRMLQRLKALGDYLVVGVSTDEFNEQKGKRSIYSYEERAAIVEAVGIVDEVIRESSWEQKTRDIREKEISVFGIGEDWRGKFDFLKDGCEVVYLSRTPRISTTLVKDSLRKVNSKSIADIKAALDDVMAVVMAME